MNEHLPAARYDMYRLIHKALRAWMAEALVAAGAVDCADDQDVASVLERVRGLLAFCRKHLHHENTHVHTAMEARAPGSSGDIAHDHDHHVQDIAALAALADTVEGAAGAARADAAHALYRRLAVFVGENLTHMEVEESHNNAVLWRTYSDEELQGIERTIVESQPPQEKLQVMRWMMAGASPAERAGLIGAVRTSIPAPAFQGFVEALQAALPPAQRHCLALAVAAPAAPAAA